MIRPAFSTVACPDKTIEQVVALGEQAGFSEIEFRSFGVDSRQFACDPALTGAGKVRRLLAGSGMTCCCLATSARFDAPVWPPVIGVMMDQEQQVRAARRAIDTAAAIGAPLVRVFAFDKPEREKRSATVARIVRRLEPVVDHARNRPVRVVVENGGAFRTAEEVAELIDLVDHPLLGACYSLATGVAAGDDPARAVSTLASRLWLTRVRDLKDGRPVMIGTGDVPCHAFVEALQGAGYAGALVYEWDRAWLPDLAPAEEVLPAACRTLYEWIGAARAARGGSVRRLSAPSASAAGPDAAAAPVQAHAG